MRLKTNFDTTAFTFLLSFAILFQIVYLPVHQLVTVIFKQIPLLFQIANLLKQLKKRIKVK